MLKSWLWQRRPDSLCCRFATGSSTHAAASSPRSSDGRGTTRRGSLSVGGARSRDPAAPRWPRWPTLGGTWGAGTTSMLSRSPCTKARTQERTVRMIWTMTKRKLSWNWSRSPSSGMTLGKVGCTARPPAARVGAGRRAPPIPKTTPARRPPPSTSPPPTLPTNSASSPAPHCHQPQPIRPSRTPVLPARPRPFQRSCPWTCLEHPAPSPRPCPWPPRQASGRCSLDCSSSSTLP